MFVTLLMILCILGQLYIVYFMSKTVRESIKLRNQAQELKELKVEELYRIMQEHKLCQTIDGAKKD